MIQIRGGDFCVETLTTSGGIKTIQLLEGDPKKLKDLLTNNHILAEVDGKTFTLTGYVDRDDLEHYLAGEHGYTLQFPVIGHKTYKGWAKSRDDALQQYRDGNFNQEDYCTDSPDISEIDPIVVTTDATGDKLNGLVVQEKRDARGSMIPVWKKEEMNKTIEKVYDKGKEDAYKVGLRTTAQTFLELSKPVLRSFLLKEVGKGTGLAIAKALDTSWGEGLLSLLFGMLAETPGILGDLGAGEHFASDMAAEFRQRGGEKILAPLVAKLAFPLRDAMLKAMHGNVRLPAEERPEASEEQGVPERKINGNGKAARA